SIDWKTGKVMWSRPRLTRTSLLYVDGHFVCLGEDGTLRLVEATPDAFRLQGEVVLQDPTTGRPLLEEPAWAAPILAHGLLYVRGADRVVCLRLIPDRPPGP
ncbi:MAG: PQQ-binding-like beta-propeller repeat protein, partial [Thermoguttaceae bacterium]